MSNQNTKRLPRYLPHEDNNIFLGWYNRYDLYYVPNLSSIFVVDENLRRQWVTNPDPIDTLTSAQHVAVDLAITKHHYIPPRSANTIILAFTGQLSILQKVGYEHSQIIPASERWEAMKKISDAGLNVMLNRYPPNDVDNVYFALWVDTKHFQSR